MTDVDHLRQWIGRSEERSEQLTSGLVDRFNATFDRQGDAAPPMIHLCLAPSIAPTSDLGRDGHPHRGGFLPPVQLPNRMWAGGAFDFREDIRVGELVTRRSTIRDVVEKQGRTGTLCFVTVDHCVESGGRLAVEERQDIVYRSAHSSGSMQGQKLEPAAAHGQYRVSVDPSATLLFRYSALTFNGHRIHYDDPYTRDIEGYPGLIVHAPLQATQLVQFAESINGRAPRRFDFRARSPLFGTAAYTLNAAEDGNGLKLWTAYGDGPVAMEARASW